MSLQTVSTGWGLIQTRAPSELIPSDSRVHISKLCVVHRNCVNLPVLQKNRRYAGVLGWPTADLWDTKMAG